MFEFEDIEDEAYCRVCEVCSPNDIEFDSLFEKEVEYIEMERQQKRYETFLRVEKSLESGSNYTKVDGIWKRITPYW